jgi:hypothetical protein
MLFKFNMNSSLNWLIRYKFICETKIKKDLACEIKKNLTKILKLKDITDKYIHGKLMVACFPQITS